MLTFAPTHAGDALAMMTTMAQTERVVRAEAAPAVLRRRLPVGAEVLPAGGVHFRVWAPAPAARRGRARGGPRRATASRCTPEARRLLRRHGRAAAAAGTPLPLPPRRRRELLPDPASRFQPDGPHGPSRGRRSRRASLDRRGLAGRRPLAGQVLYELHIGTFTPEGTWAAAARELPAAGRRSGITVARGHAGRRVPRPLRLGLRRRRPVRPDPPLRHARRLPRASSTAPTRSASA